MVSSVIPPQSTDAWLNVLQQLMPQGEAWPRDADSKLSRLLKALAKSLADIDASADSINLEMLPSQAGLLLEEYERYLGLPECFGGHQSILERRKTIKFKDTLKGGSASFQIEALASSLGFKIKVHEHLPHHCLRDCLSPIYPQRYRHIIDIDVLTKKTNRFTCIDNVLTPLTEDNRTPECQLNQYKLAGKYYDFYYKER